MIRRLKTIKISVLACIYYFLFENTIKMHTIYYLHVMVIVFTVFIIFVQS